MSLTFLTLVVFLAYLFPVILTRIIAKLVSPIHVGNLSIVEEIKQYSSFPIIAGLLASFYLSLAHGYYLNEELTLRLMLDFKKEFDTSSEQVIAFLHTNLKAYLTFIGFLTIISVIYFFLIFPKQVIASFLQDKPSEAATLEHFPLLIQVATSLFKPEDPLLNIDLVDTYNNLYSGKLASFKCNKSGTLESLVLTNTVRITKDDKDLESIVEHAIPGIHVFFFAKDIMNINISQWGVVKDSDNSEKVSELFVDMSDEELKETLIAINRYVENSGKNEQDRD